MTILYEKVGRRYKPVMTDDWKSQSMMIDMARPGHMLVSTDDNCTSYLHIVQPDRAAVLAAMREAVEAMRQAMHKAAEFKPKVTRLSEKHRAAWEKYQASIPQSERQALWAGSINDGLEAAMAVLDARLREQGE